LPKVNYVAAGENHAIAIGFNDQCLYGWGNSMDSRLGFETMASILVPEKIPLEHIYYPKFIHVTCGKQFSLAIDDKNQLWYAGNSIGIGQGGIILSIAFL
jgi:alpha-tubulin suppressor-like RCC1 family protein